MFGLTYFVIPESQCMVILHSYHSNWYINSWKSSSSLVNVLSSFQLFGCADVRVLNGGLQKWEADGYPTTTEVTTPKVREYTLYYFHVVPSSASVHLRAPHINVTVDVYSLKTPWVQQTLQSTPLVLKLSLVGSHLLCGEFSAFCAANAIYSFPFFCSTRYPLLLGGQRKYGMRSLPDTSCPLHMTSSGNWTPDLVILSPVPYPLCHMLPCHPNWAKLGVHSPPS